MRAGYTVKDAQAIEGAVVRRIPPIKDRISSLCSHNLYSFASSSSNVKRITETCTNRQISTPPQEIDRVGALKADQFRRLQWLSRRRRKSFPTSFSLEWPSGSRFWLRKSFARQVPKLAAAPLAPAAELLRSAAPVRRFSDHVSVEMRLEFDMSPDHDGFMDYS